MASISSEEIRAAAEKSKNLDGLAELWGIPAEARMEGPPALLSRDEWVALTPPRIAFFRGKLASSVDGPLELANANYLRFVAAKDAYYQEYAQVNVWRQDNPAAREKVESLKATAEHRLEAAVTQAQIVKDYIPEYPPPNASKSTLNAFAELKTRLSSIAAARGTLLSSTAVGRQGSMPASPTQGVRRVQTERATETAREDQPLMTIFHKAERTGKAPQEMEAGVPPQRRRAQSLPSDAAGSRRETVGEIVKAMRATRPPVQAMILHAPAPTTAAAMSSLPAGPTAMHPQQRANHVSSDEQKSALTKPPRSQSLTTKPHGI